MVSESASAALAFYLDASMQSWGASSKFRHRKTEAYPTPSGVLGLVATALGIDKHAANEAEQIASLAKLRFSTFTVVHIDQTKRHPILRLEDFHTVGGGL